MAERHPFDSLLSPQTRVLKHFALRLTANEHRAEDLVQITMLKAWDKRDSFMPGTNLRAWLFTILRNTFYSDLRKYRHEVEDIDGISAAALCEEPRQDHILALNELMSAIASLPHKQRKPIVMMGAYGFSQLEAAEACGCTVGTIKSRVSRARTTLCSVLDHKMIAQDDAAADPDGGKALSRDFVQRGGRSCAIESQRYGGEP